MVTIEVEISRDVFEEMERWLRTQLQQIALMLPPHRRLATFVELDGDDADRYDGLPMDARREVIMIAWSRIEGAARTLGMTAREMLAAWKLIPETSP